MMDPENQDFVAPLSLVPPRRFCCIEHPRVLIMDSPIMTCEPRAYPRQFGASLLQAFQRHIDGPARRDLRFKVRDSATSAMDLFEGLPLGDLWEEADLLPAFLYAYSSKKLRQVCRVWQSMFCDMLRRMPREWVPIMAKFKREFQEQAFGWLHSRA